MNSKALNEEAIALHRSGQLVEAERLYRRVLAADPRDFTALHFLGVIQAQQGRMEDALCFIEAALNQMPDDAEAQLLLRTQARARDRLGEARHDLGRELRAPSGDGRQRHLNPGHRLEERDRQQPRGRPAMAPRMQPQAVRGGDKAGTGAFDHGHERPQVRDLHGRGKSNDRECEGPQASGRFRR